jgi:hypothetical protein
VYRGIHAAIRANCGMNAAVHESCPYSSPRLRGSACDFFACTLLFEQFVCAPTLEIPGNPIWVFFYFAVSWYRKNTPNLYLRRDHLYEK